jgi:Activator of Hsp90 ATPase homolog 1-like protein
MRAVAARFEGVTMSSLQTESLHLTRVPKMETGMLIRKPVAEVFEAIVNPDITTKFWFTRSSGRLAVGRPVRWDWEMYGISIEVTAKAIDDNRRIVVEWPGYGSPTTIESGFTGTGDQLVKYVADSTQGFSLMLAGLKAFLEHGVRLNLVGDRYPQGVDEHKIRKD